MNTRARLAEAAQNLADAANDYRVAVKSGDPDGIRSYFASLEEALCDVEDARDQYEEALAA